VTYCVGMCLEAGLIFAADSRTNAGVDHIATFRKMHKFVVPDERMITLMSSGNLATTQSVLSLLRMRLQGNVPNLFNCQSLYEVAELVGHTLREVVRRDSGQAQGEVDFGCSFILGGQIRGEAPRLFHVYPEGNFIESTPDTPYFQIGESKYGKPIVDRVIQYQTGLEQAARCALISIDSTLRSNLSVGLPLDLLLYARDSFTDARHYNIDEAHEGFRRLQEAWATGLRQAFESLPDISLEA
jgi:putative proteasome-type protease